MNNKNHFKKVMLQECYSLIKKKNKCKMLFLNFKKNIN